MSDATRLSVRDFGAVGDGVTYDAPAFAAARRAAEEHGGGVVYVPAGEYLLDEPGVGMYDGTFAAGLGRYFAKVWRDAMRRA